MKLKLLMLIVLLTTSFGLKAEPLETGDPQEGFEYAKQVCANCHAIVSSEASPVNEAPCFDEIAKQSLGSAATIIERTEATHPTMPNIPMKRDELNDVAAYILSLDDQEPANRP